VFLANVTHVDGLLDNVVGIPVMKKEL
jgi:hypothetical protein